MVVTLSYYLNESVQHIQTLHCLQKKKKNKYIYKIDHRGLQWTLSIVLTLVVDVDCPGF